MVYMKIPEFSDPEGTCVHNEDNKEGVRAAGQNDPTLPEDPTITSAHMEPSARPSPLKFCRLLPGERRGWWSQHNYDRRTRIRAMVTGAVEDQRTRILLDTGANISMISASFARKLKLNLLIKTDKKLRVQGIGDQPLMAGGRLHLKITLGWDVVYEFEVWVGNHNGGVNLILGTDFMMPAGIRMDMYQGRVRLPDEVVIPLVGRQKDSDNFAAKRIPISPTSDLMISAKCAKFFRIRRVKDMANGELWLTR